MQIIIDIPEILYKTIKDGKLPVSYYDLYYTLRNGTPLPKGHGRLVDEREVYKKFYCRCLARVAKEVLDEIPTIIEADKAESEE